MSKVVQSIIFSGFILLASNAHAAQATGRALMRVIQSLSVTNVSDLIFSEASAGAASETIAPDQTETAQNASFEITGEPNRPINISLPADGTVTMTTAGGGTADSEIAVAQFQSNSPAQIEATGKVNLFVGATRAALSATQVVGDYEGTFIVDVVHQ